MTHSHETSKESGLTLAVIGCGNMGTAILGGVMESSAKNATTSGGSARVTSFIATTESKASSDKLKTKFAECATLKVFHGDNLKGFQQADVILLACKPYLAEKVLGGKGVRDALRGKLLISVLAGMTNEKLRSFIGGDAETSCSIIRAMPNTAAQIGEAITVIAQSQFPVPRKEYLDITDWIFQQVGKIQHVKDDVYQAAGVMAGATGAFMTIAFDGILDGAVKEGLKRVEARNILAQSLVGMAKMIQQGEHPALLREAVSSPRGTTIEGLMALERGNARFVYSQAVTDAAHRGKTMS